MTTEPETRSQKAAGSQTRAVPIRGMKDATAHHHSPDHRRPDAEDGEGQAAHQALDHCDHQGRDHARGNELLGLLDQAAPLIHWKRQGAVDHPPHRRPVTQEEEEHEEGDDQAEEEAGHVLEDAPGLGRHLRGEAAHALGDVRDDRFGRGQERGSGLRPLPRVARAGHAPLLEGGLDVVDGMGPLRHECARHQEARDHDEGGHDQRAQEGGARRAEAPGQSRVGGFEADGEDRGPGDLHEEGLDDPEEEPAQEQDGAVEEQDVESLAVGGLGHDQPGYYEAGLASS